MAHREREFGQRLVAWYRVHGRDLPWRRTTDPYRIYISEVMLHQTQVDRVIDYWFRFLGAFPTVRHLASAPLPEVQAAWKGLGYNNRARYVHYCAKAVVRDHAGSFPRTLAELQALPGVGRYTAGAIMSFAYCEDSPIVDTNVVRVLTRAFGDPPVARPVERERRLWQLAAQVIPPGQGFVLNQAIMDFGATLCAYPRPACDICPVADLCVSYRRAAGRPGKSLSASP